LTRWVCPRCDRVFARAKQGHDCLPGTTVDKLFASKPPWQREIYESIAAHVATVGPMHADAVGVGVFLKVPQKFAEVRPKSRWVSLYLRLPEEQHDRRVARVIGRSSRVVWHDIQLRAPTDVDAQVRAWLTAAYLAAEDE
jgi:hypothetical protein